MFLTFFFFFWRMKNIPMIILNSGHFFFCFIFLYTAVSPVGGLYYVYTPHVCCKPATQTPAQCKHLTAGSLFWRLPRGHAEPGPGQPVRLPGLCFFSAPWTGLQRKGPLSSEPPRGTPGGTTLTAAHLRLPHTLTRNIQTKAEPTYSSALVAMWCFLYHVCQWASLLSAFCKKRSPAEPLHWRFRIINSNLFLSLLLVHSCMYHCFQSEISSCGHSARCMCVHVLPIC